MRFEENSHCTFDERVEMVSMEIIDAYPAIRIEDAVNIAILDEPINRPADNDVKFMRYYYMLLVLHRQIELRNAIYVEMSKLEKIGLNDGKLLNLMNEIEKYILGERIDFPIISEIYGY